MAIDKQKVTVCICERCGHKWQPDAVLLRLKKQAAPRMCPNCKSLLWNEPKTSGGIGTASDNNQRV